MNTSKCGLFGIGLVATFLLAVAGDNPALAQSAAAAAAPIQADTLSFKDEMAIIQRRPAGLAPVLTHASALRSSDGLIQYIIVLVPDERRQSAPEISAAFAGAYKIRITGAFSSPELTGFGAALDDATVEALRRDPHVLYLEQSLEVRISDVLAPTPSWGQDRVDQHPASLDLQLRYGWTIRPVHVYLFDTGVDNTQLDNWQARFHPYFTAPGLPPSDKDINGHGTHVAGTIGGNLYGIAPDVDVYSVRVFSNAGTGTLIDLLNAIVTVRNTHLPNSVANMSLGLSTTSVTLDNAVIALITSGVSTIVAAGNENIDACLRSPSRVQPAIVVGATSKPGGFVSVDAKSSFSNWGSCVDVFAPGQNILSAQANSANLGTLKSGTSMAAPHATAVAALYAAQNLTPAQVEAGLIADATTIPILGAGPGSPNRMLYLNGMPPGQTSGPLLALTPAGNPMFGTKQNGQLFILYIDPNSGLLNEGAIANAIVVPGSLALGSGGDDAWGVTTAGNLIHAYWQSGAWQTQQVNVWGGGANPASLVSFHSGNPIVGIRTNNTLFNVYWDASTNNWAIGSIRDIKARFGSVKIAADGSIYGVRPDGNVFRAWWANGQWWETTVHVW